jgi:lipopolysaccharide export system protein LptA
VARKMRMNSTPAHGRTTKLGVAVLAALLPLFACALPGDREQAIYIQSDRAERDERSGTTIYTGDVEVQQGSMRITADKVTISMNGEEVSDITAAGKPATLQQQPAADRQPVQASANNIRYDVTAEILTLVDSASVTQDGATVSGERIEYFLQEQRVKASGKERVKTVIPPRRTGAASAAPASPAADPREAADGTP